MGWSLETYGEWCFLILFIFLGEFNYPNPPWFALGLSIVTTRLGRVAPSALALSAATTCSAQRRYFYPTTRGQRANAVAMAQASGETGGMHAGTGGRGAGVLTRSEKDSSHMRRALELATKGLGRTRPNPVVGCVIVDEMGAVVGEGFHPQAGEPHAEVWALRQAGGHARGGTAYVTLEPCNHFGRTPPCTSALIKSGISRVVVGMVDPDPRTAGSGVCRLADAELNVSVGVEAAACQALNAPFVHRILEKSCYGVLHCALDDSNPPSLDDTQYESTLVLPVDCQGYMEYDAIVVEGSAGVAKLEACAGSLPSTTWRVIIITASGGVEEELRSTVNNAIWRDSAEFTIVVAAIQQGAKVDGDGAMGSVHASLASRGVHFVNVSPILCQEPTASTASAVTAAVAMELHARGLLCCAWDVGAEVTTLALQGGYIQRAFVRRKRSGARVENEMGRITGNEATAGAPGPCDDGASGTKTDEREQEDQLILGALKRLSGNQNVCVRVRQNLLPQDPTEAWNFLEVLVPVDDPRESR